MTNFGFQDAKLSSFCLAIAKIWLSSGQSVVHCNCGGKCDTKRCLYKKKGDFNAIRAVTETIPASTND